MMYTCARCKDTKPEKEFRKFKNGNHCSYCKSCEVDYTRERRRNSEQKTHKKSYILKTFRILCEIMEPAEIDCLLYQLKQIKEEVMGNDS